MLSLLFVILNLTPSNILFCCIFLVTSCGLRTFKTGVGTLVSVSVAVVDARTIPWSGHTNPGSLSVCYTTGSVPDPSSLLMFFQKLLIV